MVKSADDTESWTIGTSWTSQHNPAMDQKQGNTQARHREQIPSAARGQGAENSPDFSPASPVRPCRLLARLGGHSHRRRQNRAGMPNLQKILRIREKNVSQHPFPNNCRLPTFPPLAGFPSPRDRPRLRLVWRLCGLPEPIRGRNRAALAPVVARPRFPPSPGNGSPARSGILRPAVVTGARPANRVVPPAIWPWPVALTGGPASNSPLSTRTNRKNGGNKKWSPTP